MTKHADICIPLELEGVKYEAVGFLQDGEESITLEEIFRRVGKTIIKDKEDFDRILFNGYKISAKELRRFNWLITATPAGDPHPSLISCLLVTFTGLGERSCISGEKKNRYALALRRCE